MITSDNQKLVILIHGLGRTKYSMRRLQKMVIRNQADCINAHYPGIFLDFDDCVAHVEKQLVEQNVDQYATIFVIAHSLGGLIFRALVQRRPQWNWDRFIMLGTPNSGSSVADYLNQHWLWRWLSPKVTREIGVNSPLIKTLPFPDLQGLLIRGTNNNCRWIPVNWFYNQVTQRAAGDGIVTLDEVLPPNQTKYRESNYAVAMVKDLPLHHSFLPPSNQVIRLSEAFLFPQ